MTSYDDLIGKVIAWADDDYPKFMELLVQFTHLVEDLLTKEGKAALVLARKYWVEKSISQDILRNTRLELWDFFDQQKKSSITKSENLYALKAVIGLLYETQFSDDMGDEIVSSIETLECAGQNSSALYEIFLSWKSR